jgi:hypothetical protein
MAREEDIMSERKNRNDPAAHDRASAGDAPRGSGGGRDEDERMQTSPLSLEEIARLAALEELEHFIEEPPEGELSIIYEEDVPGEPG